MRQNNLRRRTAKERKVAAFKQEVARLKRVLKNYEATYMKRATQCYERRVTHMVKRIERVEASLAEALARKDS